MRAPRLVLVVAAVLVSTSTAWRAAARDEDRAEAATLEEIHLDEVLAEVIRARPDLRAFELQTEARLAAAQASAIYPDPMIALSFNDVASSFGPYRDPMSMREIMVSQRLPWPGKLDLAFETRRALARASGAAGLDRELALIEAATAAYVELWLSVEIQSVLQRQKETLESMAGLAELDFQVAGAGLVGPLRAELALATLGESIIGAEAREQAARVALGGLSARPDGMVHGRPAAPEILVDRDELDSLLERVDVHPSLVEIEAMAESRLLAASLAEREVLPDIEVGLVYGQRDAGRDFIGLRVSSPLPVFGRARRGSEASGARADAGALLAEAEARRLDLETAVRRAQVMAGRANRTAALIEGELLPLARRSEEAAEAAYQSGAADLSALLDARLLVYELEMRLLRARADEVWANSALLRSAGQRGVPTSRLPSEFGNDEGTTDPGDPQP